MPAFVVLPLSDFPGLVSVLKRQGEEYHRLKAAHIPLAESWIVPASSLDSILRQNGKQLHLRQLLETLAKPSHRTSLTLKNQVRRLITHLNTDEFCQTILKLYHQKWLKGKLLIQAILPSGETITTQPEKGDANLIQTLLVLWAKSCVTQALKASTITQLAPSLVITHTPSAQWLGELYCRHPRSLKHNAVLIQIRANHKNAQITEVQLDSQTLQKLSRTKLKHLHQSRLSHIINLIWSTHLHQPDSVLRQLAHMGGKLSRLTAYPVRAQFVANKSGVFLTEVSLHHVD